ncbi:MAG: LamG domain-containing protein [Gammaproteobacteria bacterium]|nr:LamG domain-containing protein [Gammaproteobacteria bacterium]MCP4089804.1 LamG domain-containing protein [Gammaproteobacteria bacterium]
MNLGLQGVFRRLFCLILLGVLLSSPLAAQSEFEIKSIVAVTDNYKDNYFEQDYPESISDIPARLNFVVTPGEYEPASFVLHANSQIKGLNVRVTELSDPEGNLLTGANVDIRIVKRWYQRNVGSSSPQNIRYMTSELLVYDDTLIRAEDGKNFLKLENGKYVDISKSGQTKKSITPSPKKFPVRDANSLQPIDLQVGESRQFWVTLHTEVNTPAGLYQAVIEFVQDGDVTKSIPVAVEVLPFVLADPPIEYSFYYRGYLARNNSFGSVSSELKSESQMLADLQNMYEHGVKNPTVYQNFDSGLLDRVMQLRSEAGMHKERLYYLGLDIGPNKEGFLSPWLGQNVQEVRSVAAKYGVSDVYFYARDETRGEELAYQFPFWEAVKKAGGKVMSAGWKNTTKYPGNFEVTGAKEDLFVCNGAYSLAEAQRWHEKGRLIYSYYNPVGGIELPQTWRRNYGLLLWQAGYDGAMPYAWQHSFGDGWNDFDHPQYRDHNFTYPTVDRPIDTVQWEGFREGVDDVRYLATLLALLDDTQSKDSPYASDARAWVDQLRIAPLAQLDLDNIRAQTAAYILALSGWSDNSQVPLELTDLNVSQVEPDGTAEVSWRTSLRATTGYQSSAATEVISLSSARGPGTINHVVTVAGLEPGKNVAFTVSSGVSETSDLTTQSGMINTNTKISFIDESVVVDNTDLLINFSARSDYRSSVAVDIDQTLLGWWRFSESTDELIDLSSWAHEGALMGNAEIGDGWFGNGVSLKGDGGFVSLPDIEIAENGTVTVEGWFRFHSFAEDKAQSMGLFSGFYQHGDNNYFYFSGTNDRFPAGPLLTKNIWHHIAVIWSGDVATAKMYVDGRLVPITIQGEPEEIREIDGLNIGRSVGYFGGLISAVKNTFNGDIDEIRVWSRVLSEAEVKASYNSGQGSHVFRMKNQSGAEPDWTMIGANAADEYILQEP